MPIAKWWAPGGGYNVRHVLNKLTPGERTRIELVLVLGAPRNRPALYQIGPWELVYRKDPLPPAKHMDGPKVLLAELGPDTGAVRTA